MKKLFGENGHVDKINQKRHALLLEKLQTIYDDFAEYDLVDIYAAINQSNFVAYVQKKTKIRRHSSVI